MSAPKVGGYGLRVLPSWPYHRAHIGDVIPLPRCDRDEVERVRRAMPNGHHMEVTEVPTTPVRGTVDADEPTEAHAEGSDTNGAQIGGKR